MSNGATPPTSAAATPPTDTPAPCQRRGRLIWGWTLLGLALTWWAADAALTRLMPQSWGGDNIGGGLLLLIAAGLGVTGALLLLLHYSDPSREPRT